MLQRAPPIPQSMFVCIRERVFRMWLCGVLDLCCGAMACEPIHAIVADSCDAASSRSNRSESCCSGLFGVSFVARLARWAFVDVVVGCTLDSDESESVSLRGHLLVQTYIDRFCRLMIQRLCKLFGVVGF
jgi:hypothetical protein